MLCAAAEVDGLYCRVEGKYRHLLNLYVFVLREAIHPFSRAHSLAEIFKAETRFPDS